MPMPTNTRLTAIVLLAWTVAPVHADEICHTQGGQYAETRTCVSSTPELAEMTRPGSNISVTFQPCVTRATIAP